ncbi:MAG TPA: hypothetical protein VFG45_04960 [Candidatus Nitrosocosmicus sp.]|nr:hypothetical protein [Candidatus Nitrosocosmicus sp.]
MPKSGRSTDRDNFNRFANKIIKVQEKSCRIYALENSNDKVGINLCNERVTNLKKVKEGANFRMDIVDLLNSP